MGTSLLAMAKSIYYIDMAIMRQIMVVDEAHWFWIILRKYCFSHLECIYQWWIQTLKYRKRPPPAHPNRDFSWGTGGGSSVSNKFSWPFESQLSLKKKWRREWERGGGGGGGQPPPPNPLRIRHCLYLLSYFFIFIFFTVGNIAFCHKLWTRKREFLYCRTNRKLVKTIMHSQDPPELIKLTSYHAPSLC